MLLFFDSNVMAGVTEHRCVTRVRRWLRRYAHSVVFGDQVFVEALRIGDEGERARRIRTIFALSSEPHPYPDSYLTAAEVRDELRRHHPEWFVQRPDTRTIHAFLKRRQHLLRAQQEAPGMADSGEYLATVFDVVGRLKAEQKERNLELRQRAEESARHGAERAEAMVSGPNPDDPRLRWLNAQPEPDRYWRVCSRHIWRDALSGHPGMRDYADWLAPYLKGVPPEPAWSEFWLFEGEAERLRRDRLISICEWYQAFYKIEAGNAGDMLLAPHLMDVDIFVTADRRFFRLLTRMTEEQGPFRARVVFVARGADDFAGELRTAVAEARRSGRQVQDR